MTVLTSVCIPADAQTLPGIGKPTHRPQATLPQMYEYAFRIQNTLEQNAVDLGTHTGPKSASFPQSDLQLTQDQFAAFRSAAQRFGSADREITGRILALAAADRAEHPRIRRLTAKAQSQIDTLVAERLNAAAQEESSLQLTLDAEAAQQLDEKIASFYAKPLPEASQASPGIPTALGRSSKVRTEVIYNAPNPDPGDGGDQEDCDDNGGVWNFATGACDGGGGGGGGGPTAPLVVFSALTAVAQGGTATVTATLDNADAPQPVTLTLTTLTGTGGAEFASGGTSVALSASGPVIIKGITSSSVLNNIQLDAVISSGEGSGTVSVSDPGPLQFSVASPCPSAVTVGPTTIMPLANKVPTWLTGIGIVVGMEVGPASTSFNGVQLVESLTTTSNSCPANFGTLCAGSSTFTVGAGGTSTDGEIFAGASNQFYDQHATINAVSLLDADNISNCSVVCSQTYSCNGAPVGSFSITRKFTEGVIGPYSVTDGSVAKVAQ